MRCLRRVFAFAVVALLCACSGGGPAATTPIPQAGSTVNAPAGNERSVELGLQPINATLPIVSQITGSLLFPAVSTPTTISLSASATAPAGVALESVRRAQGGTLTVYEYVTIVSPITTTLPSLPALTLHFPTTTPIAGKAFYYGISDLNAAGGLVSFNTQGPGTIAGQTVSFAQVLTATTYEAGHKYTFVVYATTQKSAAAMKIYVANQGGNSVTTYNADGTQTTPTIAAGLKSPNGIAVDAAGKIYVTNYGDSTVTTYKPDGTQTTPKITTRAAGGLSIPFSIAVDAAGKIYVVDLAPSTGSGANLELTTYKPDGTQTSPTIDLGQSNNEYRVAVDAAGKIYLSEIVSSIVLTYNADGTRSTPTVTDGVNSPVAVAVDAAGKIYVANSGIVNIPNTITTYRPDGTRTTPTITAGLSGFNSIAVDAAGKIYAANSDNNTVTTYNPDGSRSTPTIRAGLSTPAGIAVH